MKNACAKQVELVTSAFNFINSDVVDEIIIIKRSVKGFVKFYHKSNSEWDIFKTMGMIEYAKASYSHDYFIDDTDEEREDNH